MWLSMLNTMKLVKLSEYFDIYSGIEKSKVLYSEVKLNQDYIPYITPSNEYDKTLSGFVNKKSCVNFKIYPKETIFYGNTGEGCHTYAYVSQSEFIPNNNVSVLIPKITLLLSEKLFYARCITNNRYKFSYGRIPNQVRMVDILIPDRNSIPDFVYKNKIKNVSKDTLSNKKVELNMEQWKYYSIGDIFRIEKAKCNNASLLLTEGDDIFYIGAKKNDNGVMNKVKLVEGILSKGNAIVFIGDGQGSVGYTLYQPINFIGSTTLTIGYNEKLNKYNAIFIVTVLDLERYRYSFGRKYGKETISKAKIKLPTTSDGKIDWEFMENYIKSLPYSSSL